MDVSIIILNYRAAGLVKQCIKTIKLYGIQASHEIIVVDNASEDGVADMLAERFPDVRFIPSPGNIGYAGGNNIGIKAAKGRYLLIMNPDITVRPGAVDELVRFMELNPDVGISGPRLMRPNGTVDESCFRYPSYGIPVYRRTPIGRSKRGKDAVARYLMRDYDRKVSRDVDWLLGAVLMVRRSAMEKVGLLDERFFLYFEDTDWCRRFWKEGFRVVYHTAAEMVHYHERLSARGSWLTGPLRKSARIHIASCVKYFRKWKEDGVTMRANEPT